MTYQDIANWCERNVPMAGLTNYQEWKNMCEQEFLNAGHFMPEQVYPFLEKKWLKTHESLLDKEKPIPEPEPIPESVGKQDKLFRRITLFPEDLEFTPKQVASFTGTNYNTTRRVLQELVTEGILQRIARGRYRLAP